jgi:hypothetical protein
LARKTLFKLVMRIEYEKQYEKKLHTAQDMSSTSLWPFFEWMDAAAWSWEGVLFIVIVIFCSIDVASNKISFGTVKKMK